MAGGIYNNFGFGNLTNNQLRQLDTNEDNLISKEEYSLFTKSQDEFDVVDFSIIDDDGSGDVTEEELLLYEQKVKIGNAANKYIEENVVGDSVNYSQVNKQKNELAGIISDFIAAFTGNKENDIAEMTAKFENKIKTMGEEQKETKEWIETSLANYNEDSFDLGWHASNATQDNYINDDEAKDLMKRQRDLIVTAAIGGESAEDILIGMLGSVDINTQKEVYSKAQKLISIAAERYTRVDQAAWLKEMNDLATEIVRTTGAESVVESTNTKNELEGNAISMAFDYDIDNISKYLGIGIDQIAYIYNNKLSLEEVESIWFGDNRKAYIANFEKATGQKFDVEYLYNTIIMALEASVLKDKNGKEKFNWENYKSTHFFAAREQAQEKVKNEANAITFNNITLPSGQNVDILSSEFVSGIQSGNKEAVNVALMVGYTQEEIEEIKTNDFYTKRTNENTARNALISQKSAMKARFSAMFVARGLAFDESVFNSVFSSSLQTALEELNKNPLVSVATMNRILDTFVTTFNNETQKVVLEAVKKNSTNKK